MMLFAASAVTACDLTDGRVQLSHTVPVTPLVQTGNPMAVVFNCLAAFHL